MPEEAISKIKRHKKAAHTLLQEMRELAVFNKAGNDLLHRIPDFLIAKKGAKKFGLLQDQLLCAFQECGLLQIREIFMEQDERVYRLHIDTAKIKEFENALNSKSTAAFKNRRGSSPITKISVVQYEHVKDIGLVINDDYTKVIRADRSKAGWKLLWALAEDGVAPYEGKRSKDAMEYLNINSRSKLYSNTGYTLTKIVSMSYEVIKPAVEIEKISSITLKRRMANAERN